MRLILDLWARAPLRSSRPYTDATGSFGLQKIWLERLLCFAEITIHDRVQAVADISLSALCCHSNETCASIANPPNSAQLEDTPYHSPSYMFVQWQCARDRQTDRRWPWPIYMSPRLRLMRNVTTVIMPYKKA